MHKFVALLSLLSAVALSEAKLSDPTRCLWLGRAEVADGQDSADCVATCHQFCNDNIPGEYFCTGKHVFTDNDEFVYNQTDPKRYVKACLHYVTKPCNIRDMTVSLLIMG